MKLTTILLLIISTLNIIDALLLRSETIMQQLYISSRVGAGAIVLAICIVGIGLMNRQEAIAKEILRHRPPPAAEK